MSSQPSTSSNATTPTPSGPARANKGKGRAVSSDTEESSTPGLGQSQRGKNWSERDSILLVEAWAHREGTKKCVYYFE